MFNNIIMFRPIETKIIIQLPEKEASHKALGRGLRRASKVLGKEDTPFKLNKSGQIYVLSKPLEADDVIFGSPEEEEEESTEEVSRTDKAGESRNKGCSMLISVQIQAPERRWPGKAGNGTEA